MEVRLHEVPHEIPQEAPLDFQNIAQYAKDEKNFPAHEEAYHWQQLEFRKQVKSHLFFLLYLEIAILIILLPLQGLHLLGFNLNDWAFGFFINGCLVQTFFLIKYIVHHLFPTD